MTLLSFVNEIAMTLTLLAVLLYGTFRGCYATLFISEGTHQHGMTPDRFHKECLKCLMPSRMKRSNKRLQSAATCLRLFSIFLIPSVAARLDSIP